MSVFYSFVDIEEKIIQNIKCFQIKNGEKYDIK